jgi:hypothetical protein
VQALRCEIVVQALRREIAVQALRCEIAVRRKIAAPGGSRAVRSGAYGVSTRARSKALTTGVLACYNRC